MDRISVSRFSFRRKGSFRKDKEREKEKEKENEALSEFNFSTLSYVSQEEAVKIEDELLTEYAFNVPQLLELAGYSCAVAITQVYPLDKMSRDNGAILVCCGPDNNGGHGLVCARHLKHFGYKPSIFYPKTSNQQIFENLRLQCERMDMPFLSFFPSEPHLIDSAYNLVVDAIYGSCHKERITGDFASVLETLKKIENPLVSLDIPSGWDIENGCSDGLQPSMLISLTCPKLCARHFQGQHHYLGGRSSNNMSCGIANINMFCESVNTFQCKSVGLYL
ncbi:Hypothetical predicted protein [Octopus vulgaris]|uniref:NAD(P)H-hydrate epimerase n=1 Tax=Octopus vulgaris TaxID=6645 RepID=A0AA36BLU6_OCTVU|nr:Hypothetical predicted protein [Octopus vulgaris]